MRYYVHATGTTCYDCTGLTSPQKIRVDWQSLIGPAPEEEPEIEWRWLSPNRPEVITFDATRREAREIGDRLEDLCREAGLYSTTLIVWRWPTSEAKIEADLVERTKVLLQDVMGLRDGAGIGTPRRVELAEVTAALHTVTKKLADLPDERRSIT